MIEILVNRNKKQRTIALVENGNLVELYDEDENTNRNEGNIYIGIVRDVLKGMQSAFIDIGTEKNSFIHLKDILPKIDETKEKPQEKVEIQKVVKPGQKLLVQVKKDSNDKKGARVSTHINFTSRYVVLMPDTDIVTISQKIEDEKEAERLLKLARENLTKGNGAIIRTSAVGKNDEIIKDIKKLEKKWNKVKEQFQNDNINKPKLIYKSEEIIEKMIIDLSQKKLEKIIVNSKEDYDEIKKFQEENDEFRDIKLILKDGENILDIYDIQKQIEKLNNRKIWLKCGGFITIDKTEALTAIDVNTGKYTGSGDLEQTIYKVNEEATIEIAKQLRLRDIGGIIIIDYIDMKKQENKEKIENLLIEVLKEDRTKTQVEGFTKLDLMEMTRKHICSHKD